MKCGFKIGGGIDQDFKRSPQGYTDNVKMNFIFIVDYTKYFIIELSFYKAFNFLGYLCNRSSRRFRCCKKWLKNA